MSILTKKVLFFSVVMLVIDGLWLNFYMGPKYKSYFKSLNLSMNLKVWAVGLAYLCMVLAYPLVIQDGNKKKEMIKAAAVGGIIFGTYAFTLAAVFPKYTADFAFTEFFWGIFIYTTVLTITNYVFKNN